MSMRRLSLLPLLGGIIVALCFLGTFFFVQGWFWFLVFFSGSLFIILLRLHVLSGWKNVRSLHFWNFAVPLLVFTWSAFAFGIFFPYQWMFQILAVGIGFFTFLFLRYIYIYFRQPLILGEKDLPHLSLFLNTFSVFLLVFTVSSAMLFVNLHFVFSLLILSSSTLLTYQYLWMNQEDPRRSVLFACIISYLILQIFWTSSLLPINLSVTSFLIALMYFLLCSFTHLSFHEQCTKKKVTQYLLAGTFLSLLVILTAEWR